MLQENNNKKLVVLAGAVVAAIILLIVVLLALLSLVPEGPGFGNEVGIIPLKGTISLENDSFSQQLNALDVVEKIDEASKDPYVKVIFIDIDSGGGSIVATKQIVDKIRNTDKPVVAYIGEVGASGAYYVAAASDYIIADADSITGSIGVIWISLDVNKLLDDFGVKPVVLKKGTYKDIGSMFREMTDDEKKLLQEMIDDSFRQFKGDILEFRKGKGLQLSELDGVADGRIISGRQALKLNLVDELSSREAAIKKAAEIGGIKGEPIIKNYSKEEITLADVFFGAGQNFAKGFSSSLNNGTPLPSIRT